MTSRTRTVVDSIGEKVLDESEGTDEEAISSEREEILNEFSPEFIFQFGKRSFFLYRFSLVSWKGFKNSH